LIDFYSGSSYRGGMEFRIKSKIGVYLEAGGYFKNFNGLSNIKGYIIKTDLRWYFDTEEDLYFSIGYLYKRQNYNTADSITIGNGYFKNYKVDKYINCVTLNFGQHYYLNQHFYLDFFGGLGIRYKNVHSDLAEEEKSKRFYYNDSMSLPLQHGDGKRFLPNFDLGLKLSFIIK
jgi:hypothetical protein